MSQIRLSSLAIGLLLSLSVFSLSGCGDRNSQSDLNSATGKHPSTWLPVEHIAAAKDHPDSCTDCHGSDFTGGISKVACTQCHLGNQDSKHPLLWGNFAYALHGSFVRKNGFNGFPGYPGCDNVNCHAADLTGVGGTGPSCTKCHMGGVGSIHPNLDSSNPNGWMDVNSQGFHGRFVGQNGTSGCRTTVCHGAELKGVFLSGPSCNACHNF